MKHTGWDPALHLPTYLLCLVDVCRFEVISRFRMIILIELNVCLSLLVPNLPSNQYYSDI